MMRALEDQLRYFNCNYKCACVYERERLKNQQRDFNSNCRVVNCMPCGSCGEKKEYKCAKCGMAFITEEGLMEHKKKEHM